MTMPHDIERALEPAPCTDCRFRERCARELLACDAYAIFLQDYARERWHTAPRAPTRARYEALRL